MKILISKHALRRYKQRILKRKTTSGDKCAEKIRKQIKNVTKIDRYKDTYCYYTPEFRAVVEKRSNNTIMIVTILDDNYIKEPDVV